MFHSIELATRPKKQLAARESHNLKVVSSSLTGGIIMFYSIELATRPKNQLL